MDMQKAKLRIALIDYDAGNLRSVEQSFKKLGYAVNITNSHADIKTADLLILPGQGAFSAAKVSLDSYQLCPLIQDHLEKQKPLLAICIGFQLLFTSSSEAPGCTGLNICKGHFEHFDPQKASVPHMGWNKLELNNTLATQLPNPYVYFVHSYYTQAKPEHFETSSCHYHIPFTAMLSKQNFLATQFHPEKSGETGLALLQLFVKGLQI